MLEEGEIPSSGQPVQHISSHGKNTGNKRKALSLQPQRVKQGIPSTLLKSCQKLSAHAVKASQGARDPWADYSDWSWSPHDISCWTTTLLKLKELVPSTRGPWSTKVAPKAYPDPGTLVVVPPGKIHQQPLYLANWLILRPAIITPQATQLGELAITNHVWRQYLSRPLDGPRVGSSTESKKHGNRKSGGDVDAALKQIENYLGIKFTPVVESPTNTPVLIDFEGIRIPLPLLDNLPVDLARYFVWELHELHFRAEFGALMRKIMDYGTMVHDPLIELNAWMLYDSSSILNVTGSNRTPDQHYGWMAEVMGLWPDAPLSICNYSPKNKTFSSDGVPHMVRDAVVEWYCHLFHEHFGRPPIVPKERPLDKSAFVRGLKSHVETYK